MVSSIILAEILEISGCSTLRLVYDAVLALAIPPLHNQQSFLPKTSQRSPWRSGDDDIYFVQMKFFARLLDLFEDHWKREKIRDGEATQYVGFFNPEVL
jgi:hypothetical protein